MRFFYFNHRFSNQYPSENWKRLKRLYGLTLLSGRGGRKSPFFLDQFDNNLRFTSSKKLETFETAPRLNFTSGEGSVLPEPVEGR